MTLHLHSKVALVTGASRGIGRCTADLLAAEGMHVAATARTAAELDAWAAAGPDRLALPADLRDPSTADALVAATVAHFGQLDVVVHCAGATTRGDFLTLTDDAWDDGFALKFHGARRLCRAAWPHLVRTNGSIVLVVGVGGHNASAEFAIGGAVNAALLNLTKALAARGITDGVRVNAVNPGTTATDRLRTRIARVAADRGIDPAQAAQTLASELGVARFGEPREIAEAIAWLASPRASYCQGVLLDVDGGATRSV